jgi:hypothetical protein
MCLIRDHYDQNGFGLPPPCFNTTGRRGACHMCAPALHCVYRASVTHRAGHCIKRARAFFPPLAMTTTFSHTQHISPQHPFHKPKRPRLQHQPSMPQPRQRPNRRTPTSTSTSTSPPQIKRNHNRQNRRPHHRRRPLIPLRQHPRPLQPFLPRLLRRDLGGVACEIGFAVLQGLFRESMRVAGGFEDAVGGDAIPPGQTC